MKEYLLNKFKKYNQLAIRGKSSDKGDEERKRYNALRANVDQVSDQFTRLMPPLANDLLLSTASLTTSDLISEGPLHGFVNNEGKSCTPLEATFLDGTVVAEPAIENTTVENLTFNKLSGVKYDHTSFVSGRLNNYVKELNKRFLHKEPITISSGIEGQTDQAGLYGSNRSFRKPRIEPLQDINKILQCERSSLKNTVMIWGAGKKYNAAGELQNTAAMDLAPNEMIKRYLGAGFRKSPYAYRKIYHPDNVTGPRTDYLSPEQGVYQFNEASPVLYQGSFDFGCGITGNGYLHRSFCSRGFFKYVANPESVGTNGSYTDHQDWIKSAFGLGDRYKDKFINGRPGKYVHSLAAQSEPEGLKEPIISAVAQKINTLGIDYFKPIRFHESYTGRYVNGETARDDLVLSFRVSLDTFQVFNKGGTVNNFGNVTADDYNATFEPNGTVNGSTAWKDFTNNHSITKQPSQGSYAWLYIDDDAIPQLTSPLINGSTATSAEYPWNINGVLTVNQVDQWASFMDFEGDPNLDYLTQETLRFSNFNYANGNEHWSYARHNGGGNDGISRTASAPNQIDASTPFETGICTYNSWNSQRILIEKTKIAGKQCEKFKVANEPPADTSETPTLEPAQVRVNWEIVSTDTISEVQNLTTQTTSWRVASVNFIKRGANYRGTPTLSFNGVEAYNTPAGASNNTPGSLPDITGGIGQGGRVETLQINDRGRVKGVGTSTSSNQTRQNAVIDVVWEEYSTDTAGGGIGAVDTRSWKVTDVNITSRGSNYRGTPTIVFVGLTTYTVPPGAADSTPGSLPSVTFERTPAGGIINPKIINAGRVNGVGAQSSAGDRTILYAYAPDTPNNSYKLINNNPYQVNVSDVNPSAATTTTVEGVSSPDTKNGYSVSVLDANPPVSNFVPDVTSASLLEGTLPGPSGNPQRWYKPNIDYKITGQIYIPSSNSKVDSFRFNLAGDSTQGISSQGIPGGTISGGSANFPKNQWRPFDLEFTNSGNNNFRKMHFQFLDGTSSSNLTTEGDFIAIKDFTVFEKTTANNLVPKDTKIAYMSFNAEDFFGSNTFENNKEVNFAVDGDRLDVGDTNGLSFVFPEINGFDLTTRQIRESIILRQQTADDVCETKEHTDMRYPFVTGSSSLNDIGYELKESKSSKFKGTFLWPVYLGDKLKPLNVSNRLVNTGKLFITTSDSNIVSGNKLQSGIDHDYDVFKILNDNTIKYAHIANPNLGAPDANIKNKNLQIQVKEKSPDLFNFTNFALDYNLGEEKQVPLNSQTSTSFEYNKPLFGPTEIFKVGSRIANGDIATATAQLERFQHSSKTIYGGSREIVYRFRVKSVNITDGGSEYTNNVALNFSAVDDDGGELQVYEQPTVNVNVNGGVVQNNVTITSSGEFEGQGFRRVGGRGGKRFDENPPVVTVQVLDQGTVINQNPNIEADLSLNLSVDRTDFNYGMRNYSAIDGTASSDVQSDGSFQSDWMADVPLDQDYVAVNHTVTRKEVDCVRITFIIEELFQEILQEQDPLGASVKRDGININFSIFCSFDGVSDEIYEPKETKASYYGTVTSFYAVETEEITLPSYSELLDSFPSEDVNSLAAKFQRKIEIRKNDFETTSVRLARSARVFQVKEIIKEKLQYPFSAIVKSTVDARQFSQVPNRQWRMRLKKIKVPSNYYPLNLDGSDKRFIKNAADLGTRIVYDGDWDGTFKIAWTDNPAWILYDLMINQRYGIGNRIDNLEDINIFNLYKIGRYCDAVDSNGNFVGLDDGLGGLEPRFSCNIMLEASQNAFKTITDICTVFNGMAFYANGRLDFFADQPKEPMMFFNNDNVFDGIFSYQTTNKSSQFNAAEVTFLDKDDDFTAKKETVMDEVSMRENGLLRRDVNAKGATSRGQAARLGRYILYTNKFEREIVNFKAGSDGLMLSIGDIIEIQDELKNFETSFGKVLQKDFGDATFVGQGGFRYYRFLGTNSNDSETTSQQAILEISLIDGDNAETDITPTFNTTTSPDSGGSDTTGPYTAGGITITAGYSHSAPYAPYRAFTPTNMWWTLGLNSAANVAAGFSASDNHLTVDFGSVKTLSQVRVKVHKSYYEAPKLRILASNDANFSSFVVFGEIHYQSQSNVLDLNQNTITVRAGERITVSAGNTTTTSRPFTYDSIKSLIIESGPDVDSILTNHSGAFVMAPTGQDKLTDMYDNLLAGEPVDNDVLSGLYTTQAQKLKVTGVKESHNKIKIGVEDTNGYLDLVQTGSLVNLDMQNRNVRQYRILKINPEESNLYAITATEYRKEKFDLIEAPLDFKIDDEDSFNIGIPKNTINTVTEPLGFETSLHTSHTLEQNIEFKITGDLTGNESAYQLTVIRPNGKIENKIIPKGNIVGNSFVTSGHVLGGSTGLDASFGTYNFEVTSKSSEEIFGNAPISTSGNISELYESDYDDFSALDSDTDRLTDFQENIIYNTNPFDSDTDDDNTLTSQVASDGAEVLDTPFTDPLDPDTDDGGLPDGFELALQVPSDPLDPSDDATAANPFISGFRISGLSPGRVITHTAALSTNSRGGGGSYPAYGAAPNINGLYQIIGEQNGKPKFKGARNFPKVDDTENYISNNNPYKNLYEPGYGIVRYSSQGYWRVETNRPSNANAASTIQLWTGGAGVDYPWLVTDWVRANGLSTIMNEAMRLYYSSYLSYGISPNEVPQFFFKYLGDGSVIPDNLGG